MNRNNNNEIITKKDYEVLGIKENATSTEVERSYEKLLQKYHPEKIKLEKLREPNESELKKYKEIEKVYKKFDFGPKKYICHGYKKGEGVVHCMNEFYPCLWEKVENGHRRLFCSQECYSSKYEKPIKEKEYFRQNFERAKKNLEEAKTRKIKWIKEELERCKVKPEDLEPNNRNFEQEINNVVVKDEEGSEDILRLYDISDRIEKDIYSKKKEEREHCDNCGKEIKKYKDENGHIVSGIGSVDQDGNRHKFCSWECSEKFGGWKKVVSKNAFTEILKWMEKEGITNLSLDPNSGKLVVEYGKNNAKTIEDDKLTTEQKEIKSFFQQTGKNQLSRSQVRAEIEKASKGNDNNKWLGPVIGFGFIALIIFFIGIIIYKNKKKNY